MPLGEREAEAGTVSFVKQGEKLFKKKRKAGKRVQEAKADGGKGGKKHQQQQQQQQQNRSGSGGGADELTIDPGKSARGGFAKGIKRKSGSN